MTTTSDHDRWRETIRQQRIARQWTHADLAKRAAALRRKGITAAFVARIESGDADPTVETLVAIMAALGLSMAAGLANDPPKVRR